MFTRKQRNDINRQRSVRKSDRSSSKREEESKFNTPLPVPERRKRRSDKDIMSSGPKTPNTLGPKSTVNVKTLQLKEMPNEDEKVLLPQKLNFDDEESEVISNLIQEQGKSTDAEKVQDLLLSTDRFKKMEIPPEIARRIAGFNTNDSGVDSKVIDKMIPDYKKGKRLLSTTTEEKNIIDSLRENERQSAILSEKITKMEQNELINSGPNFVPRQENTSSIFSDKRNYESKKTSSSSSSSSNPFSSTRFIDAQPERIHMNDNQERTAYQLNPDTYRNGFVSDSKISEDALLRDEFKIDPNIVMNFSKEDQE